VTGFDLILSKMFHVGKGECRLPKSNFYLPDSFGEFELHDERSLGNNPDIKLYVAIKEKE
jgi:hypothetical protein